MGMLMHHTWLKEQKKKTAKKPVAEKVEPTEETKPETAAKTGGRRKTSK